MGHEVVEGKELSPTGLRQDSLCQNSHLSCRCQCLCQPGALRHQWRTTQNGRENSCPYFDILDESSDKWVHFVYVGEKNRASLFFLVLTNKVWSGFLKIRDKTSIYTPTKTLRKYKNQYKCSILRYVCLVAFCSKNNLKSLWSENLLRRYGDLAFSLMFLTWTTSKQI